MGIAEDPVDTIRQNIVIYFTLMKNVNHYQPFERKTILIIIKF